MLFKRDVDLHIPSGNARGITLEIDSREARAITEHPVSDEADFARNGEVGQADALTERIDPDAGDAVGEALPSLPPGYSRSVVWLLSNKTPSTLLYEELSAFTVIAGQAGAARERLDLDAGDAAGDRDAGQAGAAHERNVLDAGDTVGDRDAGQVGAARVFPDAEAVNDSLRVGKFAVRKSGNLQQSFRPPALKLCHRQNL